MHRGAMPGASLLGLATRGLDRSLISWLPFCGPHFAMPFGRLALAQGDNPLTVEEVLRIQNFGRKSVFDLVLVLETFLTECIRSGVADAGEGGDSTEPCDRTESTSASSGEHETEEAWGTRSARFLPPCWLLPGNSTELRVLPPRFIPMWFVWPPGSGSRPILKQSSSTSWSMARVDLPPSRSFGSRAFWTRCPMLSRPFLTTGLLASPGKTLEHIGSLIGVTRERIRQIESRLEGKIRGALGEESKVLASALKRADGALGWRS